MKKYNRKEWTEQENTLLQDHYYTCSMRALLDIFNDKNERDIREQVARLKRKNKSFRKL